MLKVLSNFASSPVACSFSIAFGIGAMLSIANIDPTDTARIAFRQAIGGLLLLAPSVAQRFRDEDW